MNNYLAALLLAIAVAWTNIAFAQSVPLSFRPVDSAYSKPLDRIIMISANPDQLHIYDPPTNSDVVVNLSKAPLNLAISPDGTHAAVMHDSLVSYVNLSTARVEKTFAIGARTGSVTLSQTYIYVLPPIGKAPLYSVAISTGTSQRLPLITTGADVLTPMLMRFMELRA
jgi:hypothetical protein